MMTAVKGDKGQLALLHGAERLSCLQAQFELQSALIGKQGELGDAQAAEISMEGLQISTMVSSSMRLPPGLPLPAHHKPASQVSHLNCLKRARACSLFCAVIAGFAQTAGTCLHGAQSSAGLQAWICFQMTRMFILYTRDQQWRRQQDRYIVVVDTHDPHEACQPPRCTCLVSSSPDHCWSPVYRMNTQR